MGLTAPACAYPCGSGSRTRAWHPCRLHGMAKHRSGCRATGEDRHGMTVTRPTSDVDSLPNLGNVVRLADMPCNSLADFLACCRQSRAVMSGAGGHLLSGPRTTVWPLRQLHTSERFASRNERPSSALMHPRRQCTHMRRVFVSCTLRPCTQAGADVLTGRRSDPIGWWSGIIIGSCQHRSSGQHCLLMRLTTVRR